MLHATLGDCHYLPDISFFAFRHTPAAIILSPLMLSILMRATFTPISSILATLPLR